jgi:NAD(P)-dependent dehydrogenase (short-subunit alcohol dehydrogenase family)
VNRENQFDLSGRVAVVTGASRGLGQYLARALAKAGADLVITSRNADDLREFQNEIETLGRRVLALELDLRNESSICDMAPRAIEHFGTVDIFVNNAGCNVRKPAVEVTCPVHGVPTAPRCSGRRPLLRDQMACSAPIPDCRARALQNSVSTPAPLETQGSLYKTSRPGQDH